MYGFSHVLKFFTWSFVYESRSPVVLYRLSIWQILLTTLVDSLALTRVI